MYAYVAAYPTFVPIAGAPVESQRQMYDFLRDTLTAYCENPSMIGVADEADDCYRGAQLNNSKPELIKAMEKIEGKFVSVIEPMIELGKRGFLEGDRRVIEKADKTVSKSLKERLQALGLQVEQDKTRTVISCDRYPMMFAAWRAYSAADDPRTQKVTRVIAFIYQKYLGRAYTAARQFSAFAPDRAALDRLEDFFSARGFVCSNSDLENKTRFAYVKWFKEYKGGETASMRVSFNWRKERQLIFEFRVPAFRKLLAEYDAWDEATRAFVYGRLKTCDGCGYCTQTDKSGKRPRLCVPLSSGGETALKCPLFPWFTWNDLDQCDLDILSADILYFNAESAEHRKCLPFSCQNLIACSDQTLYYRKVAEDGIFAYSMDNGSETSLLKGTDFIACDSDGYYCLERESRNRMRMAFSSQEIENVSIPDNIKLISGSLMLDQDNGILYLSENEIADVGFVRDALSTAMDDGYLRALHQTDGKRILAYISVDAPEAIHEIALPSSMDDNINLCNGKVFFYNSLNTQIAYVDLATGDMRGVYLNQ